MKTLSTLCYIALLGLLVAFMPANDTFTAAEQQQISIETPHLFDASSTFNIDFGALSSNEYSFPLPVGKASLLSNKDVEITTSKGDAVKAMFNGTVRLARKIGNRGNVVVIRHDNGLETVYENNAQNLVAVAQKVKAGQTIAIVGTKNKKATCLFYIMLNGGKVNPELVLDIKKKMLKQTILQFKKKGKHVNITIVEKKDEKNIKKEDKEKRKEEKEENIKSGSYNKNGDYVLNLSTLKNGEWAFPLPGCHIISPYGGRRGHSGVDIKTKPNDNIYAAFDGVVTMSAPHYGYGLCIVIKHAEGLETLYSHQSKNLVKVGQKVKAGEIIGLTGRTGRATTPHLHFEVKWKGRRFDPTLMFNCKAHTLNNVTMIFSRLGKIIATSNK
ncbi:MAG: peptidoglycan DD-metalloendopeptidase family protein [Prevotella sp.]